jgi:hypothetical protein
MELLNDAQLELEGLNLEIGHFPDSFSEHSRLTKAIGLMESYLGDVLTEFERWWPKLMTEASNVPIAKLVRLNDFTGSYSGSRFATDFADQYDIAVGYMRQELLPLKRVIDSPGK